MIHRLVLSAMLAFLAAAPLASAQPPVCLQGSTWTCVHVGSWQSGGGAECAGDEAFANGWVSVSAAGPWGYRYAGVDNGCYSFTDFDGGNSRGSYVGVTYDDGTGGSDHLRRAHVNTGTHEAPDGSRQEYCHAGVFNGQWQYVRLADCPSGVHAPVVLTWLP